MNFQLQSPAEKAATFIRMAEDDRYGIALKRNAAMDATEALIAYLDDTEGDPDLEPYLAGIDGGPSDDREGENEHGDELDTLEGDQHEDDEDNADDEPDSEGEPLLGWTATIRQEGSGWLMPDGTRGIDAEAEHDGCEPEEDKGIEDEPHDETAVIS
jgi:hypothetical protein